MAYGFYLANGNGLTLDDTGVFLNKVQAGTLYLGSTGDSPGAYTISISTGYRSCYYTVTAYLIGYGVQMPIDRGWAYRSGDGFTIPLRAGIEGITCSYVVWES
jgi:hypothetical protein